MKLLLAALAVALSTPVLAAPTTIYFAGNVFTGSVVDTATNLWVDTLVGNGFSGSITFDSSRGLLTSGVNSPAQIGYYDANRQTIGPADSSILLDFSFTYEHRSYGKLDSPVGSAIVGKSLEGPISRYLVGASSGTTAITNTMDGPYYSSTSRSLSLMAYGNSDWIGDVIRVEQLPDLGLFDVATSQIRFSDFGYRCAYVVDGCPAGAVFDEGGLNIFGRLTYLSTSPSEATAVPEPGSLALMLVGLAGVLTTAKRSRLPAKTEASPL